MSPTSGRRSPASSAAYSAKLLARGDAFFVRYGGRAVFFGRWLPVLR
jgi:membrane protein DedA with SNARE-associated domain